MAMVTCHCGWGKLTILGALEELVVFAVVPRCYGEATGALFIAK
jgi:hypothetical protein